MTKARTGKRSGKCELLAPAGNLEKLKYALAFGADAAYAGVPDFSLRSRLKGFDDEGILAAIDYAHRRGKKIYITANIFAHNRHLKALEEHLPIYAGNLPDAFIVSDPGVMALIKKEYPEAVIHVSTQANVTNLEAVRFWMRQGASRIILARELSLEEIREIHAAAPDAELECFVHGAMCMAYSGRCFLSAWQTGRSSNLGDCAQNCRFGYALMEKGGAGGYIPVEEDANGSYLLNSKDLCLIEYLDELRAAGVTSFKIEGRAKSAAYLAQVVKAYRTALDLKARNPKRRVELRALRRQLEGIVNRGYTTGFLLGECRTDGQETHNSHLPERYEFVGETMGSFKDNPDLVRIRVHNALCAGDRIHVLQPRGDDFACKVQAIYDPETMEKITSAHGGQGREVLLKIRNCPEAMSIIRREKK